MFIYPRFSLVSFPLEEQIVVSTSGLSIQLHGLHCEQSRMDVSLLGERVV